MRSPPSPYPLPLGEERQLPLPEGEGRGEGESAVSRCPSPYPLRLGEGPSLSPPRCQRAPLSAQQPPRPLPPSAALNRAELRFAYHDEQRDVVELRRRSRKCSQVGEDLGMQGRCIGRGGSYRGGKSGQAEYLALGFSASVRPSV